MQVRFRSSVVLVLVAAASLAIHADGPLSQAADVQYQLGTLLYSEGRYVEALEAFQNALKSPDALLLRGARAGVVQAALRVAEFDTARNEGEALAKSRRAMPAPSRSTPMRSGRRACSRSRKPDTWKRCRCRRSSRAACTAWRGRCSRAASSTAR
jgi:tetratricopeptide (TPR) repeat protein